MQQVGIRAATMSFIIRVREAGPGVDMRGEVEHLRTGERRIFRDAASLIHLLENWKVEQ